MNRLEIEAVMSFICLSKCSDPRRAGGGFGEAPGERALTGFALRVHGATLL